MSQTHDYDRLKVLRAVADLMELVHMTYDAAMVWVNRYDEIQSEREAVKLVLDQAEEEDLAYWQSIRASRSSQASSTSSPAT